MSTIAKFHSSLRGVRDVYYRRSDEHAFTEEEVNELLSYKDITETFEYCDWFGSSTTVKATLTNVERDKYGLVYTVEMNRDIPKHYIPAPSEILKGKGLLFPVSYQCL